MTKKREPTPKRLNLSALPKLIALIIMLSCVWAIGSALASKTHTSAKEKSMPEPYIEAYHPVIKLPDHLKGKSNRKIFMRTDNDKMVY